MINTLPFKFHFHLRYFLLTLSLLCIEILIALYVNDEIIRPYVGDVLVVILLFCLVQSCCNLPETQTAIGVLLFSYLVEILQYFHFVRLAGLQNSTFANLMMGNYFTWIDMLCYTIGIAIVWLVIRLKPA